MDQSILMQQQQQQLQTSQQIEKTKKANLLISLLYSKKLDIKKLKETFLENYPSVPHEHRLTFYKLLLGKKCKILVFLLLFNFFKYL